MEIMAILEQVAGSVHHKVDFNEILVDQTSELAQALAQKNTNIFKELVVGTKILADRSTITQY